MRSRQDADIHLLVERALKVPAEPVQHAVTVDLKLQFLT